jgi:hypothetical protein
MTYSRDGGPINVGGRSSTPEGAPVTLADLDILIGSWTITGRTANADRDDISGDLTASPVLGGQVLQLVGIMRIGDMTLPSLEVIWHEDRANGFPAHVYSGSGAAPLSYKWDRDGNTLTHAGIGMTYTGTISADGSTISGAWRGDADRPDMAHAAYDASMLRLS